MNGKAHLNKKIRALGLAPSKNFAKNCRTQIFSVSDTNPGPYRYISIETSDILMHLAA
jgi:hypothetical protein